MEEPEESEDSEEAEPEVPVARRARSNSWPADMRVIEGEVEEVRMDVDVPEVPEASREEIVEVDAPEAPEGQEMPDEHTTGQAEARTITVPTFKPDPEPVPPPPPTPPPVPEAPVRVKRESEERGFQTLVLQPGAPAGFHEEGGVFVLDDEDEEMGEPEAPGEKPEASGGEDKGPK